LISIELIRKDPDFVRDGMKRRGEDAPIDRIIELDVERRKLIAEADGLRARRNEVSREIGRTKERPAELIEEMRGVGAQIKALEDNVKSAETEISALLLSVPNIPRDDVPVAEDESGNVVVRAVGDIPSFEFEPRPHWELGEQLGIIDFQRAVKISGSRFFAFNGKGSKLQRALISWMLDLHTDEHGYQELYLPYLVSRESVTGSGHLPKFGDTMYHDDEDDLWMVPTAEVPITNLHRGEILPAGTVPLYYVAHTPCFRREKAAAGKDTRGIKRLHQFEKVEMYKFVEPESSDQELEKLVADAEDVCVRLGIPHRVLQLCTGDMGDASAKTYDIEMWAPGSREWLEVSSCSNCTDYQARRASVRYRPEPEARARFVHTLNGSGLGLPRVFIAILENYQQADGSVVVPEVLRPYTGFDLID
jgi:seryl-tRNA synthetase